MRTFIKNDAEIEMYIDNMLACQWNLSREYSKENSDEHKMKELRAKINKYKYKIAKKVGCSVSCSKINSLY